MRELNFYRHHEMRFGSPKKMSAVLLKCGHSKPSSQLSERGIRPAGFEPATDGLEIRCSIQLSYGRNMSRHSSALASLEHGWRTDPRTSCARQDSNLRPAV